MEEDTNHFEKAYCPVCKAEVDVDQDGTCIECMEPLLAPALPPKTKLPKTK